MHGLTLYHFFDWRWVSFSSFQGWMVTVAGLLNAVVAAFCLRVIVSPAAHSVASRGPPTSAWIKHVTCQQQYLACPTRTPLLHPQVQRAKKCLDFAGTILFLHAVAVTCFSGFPKQLTW